MDAMDAVALGARVQQVADKLQLKAQEARAKGNGGAAQSLADSVADLRHAAAVLLEQRRLLALRLGAGDAPPSSSSGGGPRLRRNSSASSLVSMQSAFDAASSVAGSVAHAPPQQQSELLARLARVDKMLGKKSDEMRAKGNESAAGALQQSAVVVRAGGALIGEQQQSLQALAGSLERAQSQWRALGKLVPSSSGGDDDDGDLLGRVASQSAELATLRAFLTTALPDCASHRDAEELAAALQRERDAAARAASQRCSDAEKALEAERDHLRKQVTELKKQHAEEYLILREDVEILKNEKRLLEQSVHDVERECTERSERALAKLQAARDTAETANAELAAALAAREARVRELATQSEAWRDRFHDEQRKLSEFLAAAQKQHSTQVASLESELKSREQAIAALEKSAKGGEPEAAEATAASPVTSPALGNEAALIRLQDEHMELQALLTDCEKNLESELARSAQLMAEREGLRTRLAEMARRHESEVEALASEHDRHATALEQQHEARGSELQVLANKLASAQSECAAREQIIAELKEAVDGYRDECFKVRRELDERDAAIAQLQEQLQRQEASVADDRQQLEAELAAFRGDAEKLRACLESSSDASLEQIAEQLRQLEPSASRGLRDAIAAHVKPFARLTRRHESLAADERALRELTSAFLSSCESLLDARSGDAAEGVSSDRVARIEARVAEALEEKTAAVAQAKEALEQTQALEERLRRALDQVAELQQKCASAADAAHRLEEQLEALQAVRSQLEAELRDHRTQSVDGVGRAEASARELEELQQRLRGAEGEFERYRARSHTALKKVEKRAELLNGMRKENEQLRQRLEGSEDACRCAAERETRLADRLREAAQTQRMMQEELEQRAAEAASSLAQVAAGKQLACRQLQEATALLQTLEQEKVALVEAQVHTYKQAADAREAELASLRLQRHAGDAQIAALTEEIASLRTQIEMSDRESAATAERLQAHVRALEASIAQFESSSRAVEAVSERQRRDQQQAVASLQAAVDEERAKSAAMAAEIRRLAVEAETSSTSVAAPQSTEARATRLSEQNRVCEQRVAFLELQIDELQQRLEALDEAGGRLSEDASATKEQEATRELRIQVLDLQEQLQAFEDEKAAHALEAERGELAQIRAARVALHKASEHAIHAKQRQALVTAFEQRLQSVVDELQRGLDEHSAAFRDACAFRDAHQLEAPLGEPQDASATADTEHFEECLVMTSGVVIKAGASFTLPVVCEKRGWRVVWTFSVKEESADVGFALRLAREAVVAPQRVNALSGVFTVDAAHEGASLEFEWDNAFSWLNEKTLDYHVSVQEPLTPAKQQRHVHKLSLQSRAARLRDGLALLAAELESRAQLERAVGHLRETEHDKDAYAAQFAARKNAVAARKSELQQQMDELKTALSAMLSEQDELEDDLATLLRAWSGAEAEREDAETTTRLAEASQLEALARRLEAQVQTLEQELLACQDESAAA